MTKLVIPSTQPREGVKIETRKLTTIQVHQPMVELLVGGPYEDHPYGHTALRLLAADTDKVYDYGRNGRTWGIGSSEGEGVLNVWNSFAAYIAGENALGRVTTGYQYNVSEEAIASISKFYAAKIGEKKPLRLDRVMTTFVIEDYYALGPNCTTLSVDAAKIALPSIDREWKTFQKGRGLSLMERSIVSTRGWPNHIFMPADLHAMLASKTTIAPTAINRYEKKLKKK